MDFEVTDHLKELDTGGVVAGVDFQWNTTSRDLALDIGLLESAELDAIARDGFRRDHVVAISYRALDCELQDGSGTLADRLVDMDVVSRAQLREAAELVD